MEQRLCNTMCPKNEIELRKKQNRIHALERNPYTKQFDEKRCIKEYVRSAAGIDKCNNMEVMRTIEALTKTTYYLLDELIESFQATKALLHITDFVTDRLRAVRQDLIIMRYPAENAIPILEKIVKYQIMLNFFHRKNEKFDRILNNKLLASYFSDLFTFYENCITIEASNYPEFLSYYLLMHYEDTLTCINALRFSLHNKGIKDTYISDALKFCRYYHQRNYARVLKTFENLNVFQKMIMMDGITSIRLKYLNFFVQAYSSKYFKVPLKLLCDWLRLCKKEDIDVILSICNVPVIDEAVQFDKSQKITVSRDFVNDIIRKGEFQEILSRSANNQWWKLIT